MLIICLTSYKFHFNCMNSHAVTIEMVSMLYNYKVSDASIMGILPSKNHILDFYDKGIFLGYVRAFLRSPAIHCIGVVHKATILLMYDDTHTL